MRKPIADLHCHPSLKPTNNEKLHDIWTFKKNLVTKRLFKGLFKSGISPRKWVINLFIRDMATYTQSNLDSCYEGNNRLLFCAIYPTERPFLKPDRPFAKANLAKRTIFKAIFKKKVNRDIDNKIIRLMTGYSKKPLDRYLKSIYDDDFINYFSEDYRREYTFLLESNTTSSPNKNHLYKTTFTLVNNYEEYQQITDTRAIVGILTIEGMHALADYKKEHLFNANSIDDLNSSDKTALMDQFTKNIKDLKNPLKFEFTPFFITFSHHFNNLLAGHAKSFGAFATIFNQDKGLGLGITNFGKELITDHLLSRHNGQRILIDTKHMSLTARDNYAEIVETLRNNGDNVPIICSHTAINGIETRAGAAQYPTINSTDNHSFVSRWSINITNQDIREIFASDGLIGVCMHDGRMPGGKFKKMMKEFKSGFNQAETMKRMHSQLFLTNIFHIVRINLSYIERHNQNNPSAQIPVKDAWKTMCLGSDNDGVVDPFDHFNTAATLDDFKHRIGKHITLNFKSYMKEFRIVKIEENSDRFYSKTELTALMLDYSPEELSDLIFCDNVQRFLPKYFSKTYLNN